MIVGSALLGAALFGAAAYLGTLMASAVCANVVPFEDGPVPGRPPVAALAAAGAVLGAFVTAHGVAPAHIGLLLVVCAVLAACWASDVACGIVPDLFTLVPLAAVVLAAAFLHDWWIPLSAAVALLPFACAAAASRGRGMGWGDVKLAALGGALLGMQTATLAFAVACTTAVAVAYLGRRRGAIAFAPYLTAAIGIAIAIAAA